MILKSPEFGHNQSMPAKFTCQGQDINPALTIEGIPAEAKSLALIMDDPDAPMATWIHWVVYNIPLIDSIAEDSVPGVQGKNSWGRNDYGGPCPPSGTHRYFFKLYALDSTLDIGPGTSKRALEEVMKSHIIEQTELIGLYQKH